MDLGTVEKGIIKTGAHHNRCHDCTSTVTDLKATVFADQQLSVPAMIHHIRGVEEETATEIFLEFDRSHGAILAIVHEVQDALVEALDFNRYGVSEAHGVDIVADEKEFDDEDGGPGSRGLSEKEGGTVESDNSPVVIFGRRTDGRGQMNR